MSLVVAVPGMTCRHCVRTVTRALRDVSGVVTVVARRPSSLPTQIPTTIEGISGEVVSRVINATDTSS